MNYKFRKWEPKDINFLIKNYTLLGPEKCAGLLNRSKSSICTKAFELGIKVNIKDKTRRFIEHFPQKNNNEYNVNPDTFISVSIPESAYLLGFIWADGCVVKKQYKNRKENKIVIANKIEDSEEIKLIAQKTGDWKFHIKPPQKMGHKHQGVIQTSNKILVEYLISKGYGSKSFDSADKILETIPENFLHYWFRGLLDGDGCIYVNYKKKCAKVTITSALDQNWKYLEDLLIKMKITYYIRKIKNNIGCISQLFFSRKSDISKFLDFVYGRYENDKIGLSRKYKKYMDFISVVLGSKST